MAQISITHPPCSQSAGASRGRHSGHGGLAVPMGTPVVHSLQPENFLANARNVLTHQLMGTANPIQDLLRFRNWTVPATTARLSKQAAPAGGAQAREAISNSVTTTCNHHLTASINAHHHHDVCHHNFAASDANHHAAACRTALCNEVATAVQPTIHRIGYFR